MIRKYTDQHVKLIQTKTEPLRNKQILPNYFDMKDAIFKLIYLHLNKNPPSKR